jgi:hypothetical protein
MTSMDRRIEAAAAAMRAAEAAMSKLVEREPSLGAAEEASVVLAQLRVAITELDAAGEHEGSAGAPAGHPADSGGQPLPDRATEGRPPIDA